jgi:hypothetical protein
VALKFEKPQYVRYSACRLGIQAQSLRKYGCFRAPRNVSEIVGIRKRITRPDPEIQGL